MKIGLITTLKTNIGDDFIREGICSVLRRVFPSRSVEFVPINKHKPYTAYPTWHPARLASWSERLPAVPGRGIVRRLGVNLAPKLGNSFFDSCDLIVQCGAPVFWPNCHANEWAKPLWSDVVGRLYKKIPVLNLAAGSCYPWENQKLYRESPDDRPYIEEILSYCRLTTVRDGLAKDVCNWAGFDVPAIPCSAFLAAKGQTAPLDDSGLVLINFMEGGGHFSWGQGTDSALWRKTVLGLIERLRKRHSLALLCHDENEYQLAHSLAPDLPRIFPKTPVEYFAMAKSAKFALCNRMHASVGMAGLGIPSIAVCTDTRLLMVKELGLSTHYVKDVTLDALESETEAAVKTRDSEKERLLCLQHSTLDQYVGAVEAIVS
ncbi:polysaccharide pyruvyl transferase family protein [Deltaproteobacteria bacterium IMCC39524]|nr:polysaccharide pyruvyl transferase family protein [Deltaproteobacteria bacterium IMCC39524]